MEKCKENGIEIDCECGKLNPPLSEEKKLKCLERNGEDCEEDIYGNCYHCGRYMLSVENDLVDWEKELTEQIDKNPDFVFYDFDGGLGKDLISFISNLLSSNTERVKKIIESEKWELYTNAHDVKRHNEALDRIINKLR